MKKLLLLTSILILTGCANAKFTPQPSGQLTEADAKQIALKQAGLETAVFTKQEYDSVDVDFEFEFVTDDKKYECEIDAMNGKIVDFSVEDRYDR